VQYIVELLRHNQYFAGSLFLVMSGAALAVMREFPRLLCAWLCERFVVSVTLTNEDELYDWFRYWLARHPYSKRARSVWASLRWVGGGDDDDERPHVLLSPSTGVHFMLYRRRPMWLSRSRDTKAPPLTRAYGRGARVREQLVICTLGRDQRIVHQLLEDVVALETRLNERRLPLYVNVGEDWERVGSRTVRSMDSIILPEGLLEKIVADLAAFRWASHIGAATCFTDRRVRGSLRSSQLSPDTSMRSSTR
jgi:hypothetical protein